MATISTLVSNMTVSSPSQRLLSSVISSSWTSWILPVCLAYPLLVASLRFRRINALEKRLGYTTREQMAKMTDLEAYDVMKSISDFEFPALFEKGLQLALFRTYGIPSIAKLLVKTNELSSEKNVGKRYADTAAIIAETYGNSPTSDRTIDSIARLNYIHGHYIKQGKITNDDLLYTLALFMNQSTEWINNWEWRKLTDLEICAIGVFHKSWGDALEISYTPLPGASKGFKDGLQFFKELDQWSKSYEEGNMVPDRNCYDVAIQTQNLFLSTIPKPLHSSVVNVLSSAMDDRLRHAIMFENPSPIYKKLLTGFLEVRRYYLRYLALPRSKLLNAAFVNEKPGADGRRTFSRYDTLPIYVKPTFLNRWGPSSWLSRYMGVPLPGDEGMYPGGFKPEEVGPRVFKGKGMKEFEMTREKLHRERMGGCPFSTVR